MTQIPLLLHMAFAWADMLVGAKHTAAASRPHDNTACVNSPTLDHALTICEAAAYGAHKCSRQSGLADAADQPPQIWYVRVSAWRKHNSRG